MALSLSVQKIERFLKGKHLVNSDVLTEQGLHWFLFIIYF